MYIVVVWLAVDQPCQIRVLTAIITIKVKVKVTIYRQKPFCFSSAARTNGTWLITCELIICELITCELANQRVRIVLFTCVVYPNSKYPHILFPLSLN